MTEPEKKIINKLINSNAAEAFKIISNITNTKELHTICKHFDTNSISVLSYGE